MTKSLIQKFRFKTSTFTIEDTGLLIQTLSKQESTELHFTFEQIKINRASTLDHNKGVLILAIVFAGIALLVSILSFFDKTVEWAAVPIWATISIGLFIIYIKTRHKKVYLQTSENKTIEFLADKKRIDSVNMFIEQLLIDRNSYLFSKYATLNKNLDYSSQFDSLNWLLNNRAISKAIYDEKIEELNLIFNSHLMNKPIGFSTNN
jgi:hypothetical protein